MSLLASLTPLADWNGPGWWVVFFPIAWFSFFLLAVFVFRRFAWGGAGRGPWGEARHTCGRGGAESASKVLDRRFAEGEIDAEEYRGRRATLEGRRADGVGR